MHAAAIVVVSDTRASGEREDETTPIDVAQPGARLALAGDIPAGAAGKRALGAGTEGRVGDMVHVIRF
jgi:hypothetical protein